MKSNKLTPGQNLLWESTRMFLPEHKEALLRQKSESQRRARTEFDDQQIEQFERMIQQYIYTNVKLYIVVYGEYEDTDLHGKITKFDSQMKRMKVEWQSKDGDDEFQWVSIYDIEDIFV
jgi:hypothetical protein